MTITFTPVDAVDAILGASPGSSLDQLRRRRPVTRENTQASYLALFHADELIDVSLAERFSVAAFVAALHQNAAAAEFYRGGLSAAGTDSSVHAAVLDAGAAGATVGPYGYYRESGLQSENQPGLRWRVPEELRDALGARLGAALEHAHLLVFRPRESSPAALTALLEVGWSTTGIVTLSQLVAFLSYQLRVVSGLNILDATLQASPTSTQTASPTEDHTVRIGS